MVFLKPNRSSGRVTWYLAHGRRVGGTVRTELLRSLGPLTPIQVEQYRRFLALLDQGPDAVATATAEFQKAKPFEQRRHGVAATVRALFEQLGLRRILLDSFAGIENKARLRRDLRDDYAAFPLAVKPPHSSIRAIRVPSAGSPRPRPRRYPTTSITAPHWRHRIPFSGSSPSSRSSVRP